MATYCIGDLHGREDLFFQLLEKIEFTPEKDKLYVLGDVIDGSYGGIKIIHYLKSNSESCVLVRGNHEEHFLHMKKAYDTFMLNPKLKEKMKEVLKVYSEKLYEQIEKEFLVQVQKNGIAAIETAKIKQWIEAGNDLVRRERLLSMAEFIENIGYNQEIYKEAKWIWSNLRGRFDTKNFALELFEQSEEDYQSIVEYLGKTPRRISLQNNGRDIILVHAIQQISENVSFPNFIMFPHATTKNATYIFGHEPVPKIHGSIYEAYGYCGFSFDFRRVFAYCDDRNNRYYNLDLGSNPVVALCLDNMNEYYVGVPSKRKDASEWEVPTDKIEGDSELAVTSVEMANFFDASTRKNVLIEGGEKKKNRAYVTREEGCYDFLIGIQVSEKKILYTRIDLLDYNNAFGIEGWFEGQSIEDVVQKVQEDFALRVESGEVEDVYKILYGTELNQEGRHKE